MIFPDLLFAFVIGLIFTAIFAIGFGRRGPWSSIPVFFLLVFLAAWVGGAWAAPAGPSLWGGYWLPFAFMGLLIALILVAAAPAPRSTVEIEDIAAERQEKRQAAMAFDHDDHRHHHQICAVSSSDCFCKTKELTSGS